MNIKNCYKEYTEFNRSTATGKIFRPLCIYLVLFRLLNSIICDTPAVSILGLSCTHSCVLCSNHSDSRIPQHKRYNQIKNAFQRHVGLTQMGKFGIDSVTRNIAVSDNKNDIVLPDSTKRWVSRRVQRILTSIVSAPWGCLGSNEKRALSEGSGATKSMISFSHEIFACGWCWNQTVI